MPKAPKIDVALPCCTAMDINRHWIRYAANFSSVVWYLNFLPNSFTKVRDCGPNTLVNSTATEMNYCMWNRSEYFLFFEHLSYECNTTYIMGSQACVGWSKGVHACDVLHQKFSIPPRYCIYHLVACHHCRAALVVQVLLANLQLSRHNKRCHS